MQLLLQSCDRVYANTAVFALLWNVCIHLRLTVCTLINVHRHIYTHTTISQYVKAKLFKTSHLEQNNLNILSFPVPPHLKHSITNPTELYWCARLHQPTPDAGCFSLFPLTFFNGFVLFKRHSRNYSRLKKKKISSSRSHQSCAANQICNVP